MEVQNNSGLTCIKVDVLPVPSNGWVKDDDASTVQIVIEKLNHINNIKVVLL